MLDLVRDAVCLTGRGVLVTFEGEPSFFSTLSEFGDEMRPFLFDTTALRRVTKGGVAYNI